MWHLSLGYYLRFRPAVSPSIPRPYPHGLPSTRHPVHSTYVGIRIFHLQLLLIRLHQHHLLISDMHNCKCSSYLKSYLGFHHWYGISTWVAMCCMLLLARVSALWYFRFNLQEQDSVTIIFVLFS